MKNTILNTDKRLFLITFLFKSTESKFIVGQNVDFKTVLQKYDMRGIKSIKEFDPIKNTFKRISKKTILEYFSWNTEVIQYLKKHYYFN